MSRLAKVSKYRHTNATPQKSEKTFRDLKVNNLIWDCSDLIACNTKFMAFCWAGAGAGKLVVKPLDKPEKSAPNPPNICGHKGQIIDWKFHPYHQNLLVTGSEDCTIKVWNLPEGGLTEDMTDPMVTHQGHGKKVGILSWHPSAEHVLATAAMDHTVKLWDIENGERGTITCHTDQISSVNWNLDGSLINTTSKDKKVRIIDPRTGNVVQEVPGHEGTKTQRSVWAKRRNQIVTTGFSKKHERQMMVWDVNNMATPLHVEDIDSQSGVLMPFVDEDTNMLYVGGKGDGNIRYYELWNESTPITELDCFSSSTPAKGLCLVPKTALDIKSCEVSRVMKLETTACIPISFKLPRKTAATEFQEDVYPPTFSSTPSMTAADYFKGENAEPKLTNMRPYWEGTVEAEASTATLKMSSAKLITETDIADAEKKVTDAEKALEAAKEELQALKEKKDSQ
eukprot:TRINITY_DN24478_c0_g1_i1.p1 TRINITY_DN24478_c0_g1~~TRINITY_DN24478_c0_g1_i1.p1  ORF type:complete len:453 (+),score=127.91 TRINITY_DN24478_c0_g1_i1:55-1413(+)